MQDHIFWWCRFIIFSWKVLMWHFSSLVLRILTSFSYDRCDKSWEEACRIWLIFVSTVKSPCIRTQSSHEAPKMQGHRFYWLVTSPPPSPLWSCVATPHSAMGCGYTRLPLHNAIGTVQVSSPCRDDLPHYVQAYKMTTLLPQLNARMSHLILQMSSPSHFFNQRFTIHRNVH